MNIVRILEILKNREGYVSGEELSKELGISREAVWKNILLLKRYGYVIEAKKGKGYKLIAKSKLLLTWEIQDGLDTEFIGKKIIHKMSIDSTQDLAISIADKEEEGTIIIAEEQRRGRGRRGRVWHAPKGGIWFSLILKPEIEPWRATLLPLAVGLAITDTIAMLGLEATLKWPNDVMINDRKVSGILLDMSSEQDKINYIVIGIGINANIDNPSRYADNATSLKDELKRDIDRIDFMRRLLKNIEKRYMQLDDEQLLEDYKKRCITLNKRVKVRSFDEEYDADAVNIDRDGSLIVVLDDNSIRRVFAGDVSIRI
ncbi:MAG: bifunctional ligase/repressor BirA [Candidatus Nitrosocaldaceae archaeon]|nr:MAG: bifunctional ligase/repressor BirA [Candidatus Nitrosocaldaceae archaeon]